MYLEMKHAKEIKAAGKRVMQLRLEKRYTREQFAYRAGISEKFLYEIETGKKGFSAVTLMQLSEALDVSMEFIMTGSNYGKLGDRILEIIERFGPDRLNSVQRLLEAVYDISKGNG